MEKGKERGREREREKDVLAFNIGHLSIQIHTRTHVIY